MNAAHTLSRRKFLVSHTAARHVRDWAADHLDPDPYGTGAAGDEYGTTSVYFDTDGFDVFHRRASFGRAKYRVRRYGQHDSVFLERKLRTPVLLAKRRTSVPMRELPLVGDNGHTGWPGTWFLNRVKLRRLIPTCDVLYQRIARVSRNEHGLVRLTIDCAFGAARVNKVDFTDRRRLSFLSDHVIVELNYRVTMPAIFKRLVERFALAPVRISKYRLALSALATSARADRHSGKSGNDRDILWESWSPDNGGLPPARPEL